MVTSLLGAVGLFIATNIDDIIVLSLFFARGAGQRGTTARILAGQYLGFGGILAAAGVSSQRLIATGAGFNQPIASNDTAAGRAQNRRVEIVIRPN